MKAPLRVLVVDDDADIRVIAQLSLTLDTGITVVTAGTFAETATALAAGAGADAILLDVMMPDMDGPTMLGRIRAMPGHADTPILFMTARARTADIEHYRALGAAGVIVKPFDPLRLAGEVRAGIAQRE